MNIIKYYFNHFKETWRQNIIYIGFIVVFLFFAITLHDSGFLSLNNILNIGRQTAIIAIMAVAMTLVLSSGEIDLSVGCSLASSSVGASSFWSSYIATESFLLSAVVSSF